MRQHVWKRWVAVFLAVALCIPMLPMKTYGVEDETQAWTEEAEIEDASAQLGVYTAPTQTEEPLETDPASAPEAENAIRTLPMETEPAAAPLALEPQVPLSGGSPADNQALALGRASIGDPTILAERIEDGQLRSESYVILGSRQQLEALDEGATYNAMGPIWALTQTRPNGVSTRWTTVENSGVLVYPGDADLVDGVIIDNQGTVKDFSGYDIYGKNGSIHGNGQAGVHEGKSLGDTASDSLTATTRTIYVGGTLLAPNEGVTSYNGSYSNTGRFVLIRDVSLAGYNWKPLMFYGVLIGVRGADLEGLSLAEAVTKVNRSTRSAEYSDQVRQPVISDVTVNVTGKLDPDDYVGVGFFATLSSSRPGVGSGLNFDQPQTVVRNLFFNGLSVTNRATGIRVNQTLVSGLTTFLGGTVGLLLDVVVRLLLGKESGFRGMLSDLLNARSKDLTNLATGSFAGRINGNVLVERCDVYNPTVDSVHGYTGGYVGYSTGIVQYDALSGVAGGLLELLTNILNLIPGLGLGDLITIVKQTLPLDNLIPIGYWNPWIKDCYLDHMGSDSAPVTLGVKTQTVERDITDLVNTSSATVTLDADYNGGFIGCKIATVMLGCEIKNSTYTVAAHVYAGGFAGLARDAIIPELLGGLGIDVGLMRNIMERLADANVNLQSVQVRCNILDSNVTVHGDKYLGGFNGAMTNAYCINNRVSCPGKALVVTGDGETDGTWPEGKGEYVGGFVGLATLGYAMSIGQGMEDPSLLGTVSNLLSTLLAQYGDKLLDLSGVGQSEILGLQFDFGQLSDSGDEAVIRGSHYVGGLVGQGDALIMGGATDDNLEKITYIRDGDLTGRELFPESVTGTGFTVRYLLPDGVTGGEAELTGVLYGDEITLAAEPSALPQDSDHPDNAGYNTFVGWTTADLHDTDSRPTLFAAGSSYRVTRDVTFRPVYQKAAVDIYVLMLDAPSDNTAWGENYVITYGTQDDLVLLTGLPDDARYDAAGSAGATPLVNAIGGTYLAADGRLENVDSAYIFTAQHRGSGDYSFCNQKESTYLQGWAGTSSSTGLYATKTYSPSPCQWNMALGTEQNFIFKSDNSPLETIHRKPYAVFDSANAYFRLGTAAEAGGIYFWQRTDDGPYYTTATQGSGASVEVPEGVVYDRINLHGLKDVSGVSYIGGIAGLLDTASVGSVIGDTAGLAKFESFDISSLRVNDNANSERGSFSTGLTVTATDYYAAGGAAMAVGGDIRDVEIHRLISVTGKNCVGGFAGIVGPGSAVGTGGLEVKLLGLDLISANNLLGLAQGLETRLNKVLVEGIPEDGFTVLAAGQAAHDNDPTIYCAGGFFGRSNSTVAHDCSVKNLNWVRANMTSGRAGGFLGVSQVGGLAELAGSDGKGVDALRTGSGDNALLKASDLLGAVSYLIPEYKKVDVHFVNSALVQAAYAGGFAADMQSGTVNNIEKDPIAAGESAESRPHDWYAVYDIKEANGSLYAGGFGGKVWSGALAEAGKGISILGGLSNLEINVNELLGLVNAYIPVIQCAGVKSGEKDENTGLRLGGFTVTVSSDSLNGDKTTGAAGGFIGYGSGVQVSYSDVNWLKHTEVQRPEDLDGLDGTSYFRIASTRSEEAHSAYAVTSTRYAGGYMGFMDVGSAASLGGGLGVLGSTLSLRDVLGALDVVVSTVEHSDVYGADGGFAVLASASAQSSESQSSGELTIYVVDETRSTNFNAYLYQAGAETQPEETTPWPGKHLTQVGTDKNGNPYYMLEQVDPTVFNTVIFNNGANGQNPDGNALSLAGGRGNVLYVYNYSYNNDKNQPDWVTSIGWDLWPSGSAEGSYEGCAGTYTRYIGLSGTPEDTPKDQSGHRFGALWVPNAGSQTHSMICKDCGYQKTEACSIVNGYCSVCGRRDLYAEDGIREGSGWVGRAGGFAGWVKGGHIQDSNVWNFSDVIGRIAAGGYAGEIEPGSVADALGDTAVLGGVANISGNLLAVGQDFVPSIRNSVTTAIPCGGVVRADAASDAQVQRGMAGGYVGHNNGGQIWGNNDKVWKPVSDTPMNINGLPNTSFFDYLNSPYVGPKSECAAVRLLSVFGSEYAGGFTGLMDAGSTADTGNVSLLWGLVKADGLLSALKVAYATEENTATYGPLYGLDVDTWNAWVNYVGQFGGYGMRMTQYDSQAELEQHLGDYLYGYHITAGRKNYEKGNYTSLGGYAGGYVGAMRSGTVTNGQAHQVKQVVAMHAAGGFAGEMRTGSAATLGSLQLLGLPVSLTDLLPAVGEAFVPVVKSSSVEGYQSGMTIMANGDNLEKGCGDAGGFVGSARGAQIWGESITDENNKALGCNVEKLKKVLGRRYVGGYVGELSSGTAAEVDSDVSNGALQELLDGLIDKDGGLGGMVSLLNATVSTLRYTTLSPADEVWGYTVGGWIDTSDAENPVEYMPLCAGGFAGRLEGAVIGNNKEAVVGEVELDEHGNVVVDENGDPVIVVDEDAVQTSVNINVSGLRAVDALHYAGGFLGLGDVGGVANVGKSGVSLLSILSAGGVNLLDVFRPYIFNAKLRGVDDEGFTVLATRSQKSGIMATARYSGCAGGFGGGLLNGTVENSKVYNLNAVKGVNYVGGFIGFTGKSGVLGVDEVSTSNFLSNLIGLNAGLADVVGSTISSCSVEGISTGYTVDVIPEIVTAESAESTPTTEEEDPTDGNDSQTDGEDAETPAESDTVVTLKREPIAGGFVGYGDLVQIDDCHATNLKYVTSGEIAGGFIGKTSLSYLVEAQVNGELTNLIVSIVDLIVNRLLNLDDLSEADLLDLPLIPGISGNPSILGLGLLTDGNLVKVELLGLRITVSLGQGNNVAKVTIGDSYIELPIENGHINSEDLPSNLTIRLIRGNYSRVRNSSVTGIPDGFDVFGGGSSQEDSVYEGDNDGLYRSAAGGFVGWNEESSFVNCEVLYCDVVKGAEEITGPFSGKRILETVYNSQNYAQEREGVNNSYAVGAEQVSTPHNPLVANLAVFSEPGKVVLMEDRPLQPNLQSLTTETADMQNPCLPFVDLTLYKVWDDRDGMENGRAEADDEHPVSVTFGIYRILTDASGNPLDGAEPELVDTVVLTKANATHYSDNVWSWKGEKLEASATEADGSIQGWYRYYAEEVDVSGIDYSGLLEMTNIVTAYADADVSNKLSFSTDAKGGYVFKVTNQYNSVTIVDQTIVVDFGLPVDIHLMDYLRQYNKFMDNTMDIKGLLSITQLNDIIEGSTPTISNTLNAYSHVNGDFSFEASATAENPRYGSFSLKKEASDKVSSIITYTPGSMQFDKPIQIAVALSRTTMPDKGLAYVRLTVVPASIILYEADNRFITFKDGTSTWQNVGSLSLLTQSEDRPGLDFLDGNNIYGYDERYNSETNTYSLSNAKKVTVHKGDSEWPSATFTFTGTGFDLIAVTENTSGLASVQVLQEKEGELTRIRNWTVDSYYGTTREQRGYTRYVCIYNGEDWTGITTALPDMTAAPTQEENKLIGLDQVYNIWSLTHVGAENSAAFSLSNDGRGLALGQYDPALGAWSGVDPSQADALSFYVKTNLKDESSEEPEYAYVRTDLDQKPLETGDEIVILGSRKAAEGEDSGVSCVLTVVNGTLSYAELSPEGQIPEADVTEGMVFTVKVQGDKLSFTNSDSPLSMDYPLLEDYPVNGETDSAKTWVVYKPRFEWVSAGESADVLYQVPVIHSGELPYGTYTVVVTPVYVPFYDHNKAEQYSFYIDGVRIYRPAESSEQEDLDKLYYSLDHEGWPQFLELRSLLLSQASFGTYTSQGSDTPVTGALFFDGNTTAPTLADYTKIGPNNEIYLLGGQAVAFSLEKPADLEIDRVHVSAKRILTKGGNGEASLICSGGDVSTNITFSSATEMYYDITSAVTWKQAEEGTEPSYSSTIVLCNPDPDTVISLRNLKITYTSSIGESSGVQAMVDPSTVGNAVSLIRSLDLMPVAVNDGAAFQAVGLSLSNHLGMRFYVPAVLLADAENVRVRFVKGSDEEHGETFIQYDTEDTVVNDIPCKVFVYRGTNAKDMGSFVTARLFYSKNGVDHISEPYRTSLEEQALALLRKEDTDDATKTLLVDLLNYGAAAQTYAGLPGALPDAQLTEAEKTLGTSTVPTVEALSTWSEPQVRQAVEISGATLILGNGVVVRWLLDWDGSSYAASKNTSGLILRVSYIADDGQNKTVYVDGCSFETFVDAQNENKQYLAADFDLLSACELRKVMTAQVLDRETMQPLGAERDYSVESYAAAVLADENADDELKTLVKALMVYGDSAYLVAHPDTP